MKKLIISGGSCNVHSKYDSKELERTLQHRLNGVLKEIAFPQMEITVSAFDIVEELNETKIVKLGTHLYSEEWDEVTDDIHQELDNEKFDEITKQGVITGIKLTYPDPNEYGTPDALYIDGALEFLSGYGFKKIAPNLEVESECLYDDGAPYMEVTVVL